MSVYSEAAWNIAILYSRVLASETRDLAAHIDAALTAEREACAAAAYTVPDYVRGSFQTDADGLILPGSVYDQGRYDARKAIAALPIPLPPAPESTP